MPAATVQHRNVLLVGNPISGRRKVRRYLGQVAEALRQTGLAVEVLKTSRAGEAERAARSFNGSAIVAFGGDGTFNEVLNGANLERCALGIVPAGTGNVLAKELGMPRNPVRAARELARAKTVRFDVGLCNGRRFICMVGAGVDARVVQLVHESRAGGLSQLDYLPAVMQLGRRPESWNMRVQVDGRLVAKDATVVCVGNVHSYGGPIEMTPRAVPADGLLDVMVLRVRGLSHFAGPTVALLLRSLHGFPGAIYVRGRQIRIAAPDKDAPWQADGDVRGVLPVSVTCCPRAARVMAPAQFEERAADLYPASSAR